MRRHLLLASLACVFAVTAAGARTLTPQQALARVSTQTMAAGADLRPLAASAAVGQTSLLRTLKSCSEATVYIFKPASGQGFMCVAADDAAPQALLGYSPAGEFEQGELPPAMEWWLQGYSAEIAAARAAGLPAADDAAATDSVDSRADIEPILTTTWGQLSPFNDLTPEIGGVHSQAGCVATSLAQCMKVERWPDKPHGSMTYDWWNGASIEKLSLDFDTISYDWDLMIDHYDETSGGTAAQRAEVAKLLYSVGVSVRMQYNPNGSGSSYTEGAAALIEYFDYAESVCYFERDYFELEEWKAKIYDELALGRPVPYAGEGDEGGHAFVCDGYRSGGYFHFNWGWYGSHDGFFLLSALNPGTLEGFYEKGYNRGQNIITGLVRASKYAEPALAIRISGNFETTYDKLLRTDGGKVTFKGASGIYSRSYAKATVTFGVKLTAVDGTVSYAAADEPVTMQRFVPVTSYDIDMSKFPDEGSYTVSPAYCDSIGQWHDMAVKIADVGSLNLTASSKSLIFGDSDLGPDLAFTDMTLESPLFIGREFGYRATITNSGTEFLDDVYVTLADATGMVVAVGPVVEVDVPRGDTQNFEWVGKFNATPGHTLAAGNYNVQLSKISSGKYVTLSPAVAATLREASEAPTVFTSTVPTVNGVATTLEAPGIIDSDNTELSVDITCTQGYFGERICMEVLELDYQVVLLESDTQFAGVDEGQTKTFTFNMDLSSLEQNTRYRVLVKGLDTGLLKGDDPAYIRIGETGIAVIETDAVAGGATVSPNPAESVATVTAPAPIRVIEVYSVSGTSAHVETTDIDGCKATIDVAALPAGIYIVRIVTDSRVYNTRLVRR